MAHRVLMSNRRRNTHKFFVDTVDDLQKLTKEAASTALVATTGDTYICTNSGEWVKFNKGMCPHGESDDSGSGGNIELGNLGYVFVYTNNEVYSDGRITASIENTPVAILDPIETQFIAGGLNCVLDCPDINPAQNLFNIEAITQDEEGNEIPFTDFTYNTPSRDNSSQLLMTAQPWELQITFTMPDIPLQNDGDTYGGLGFNITWDNK